MKKHVAVIKAGGVALLAAHISIERDGETAKVCRGRVKVHTVSETLGLATIGTIDKLFVDVPVTLLYPGHNSPRDKWPKRRVNSRVWSYECVYNPEPVPPLKAAPVQRFTKPVCGRFAVLRGFINTKALLLLATFASVDLAKAAIAKDAGELNASGGMNLEQLRYVIIEKVKARAFSVSVPEPIGLQLTQTDDVHI